VLGLFLIIGGMNLALMHGDFQLGRFVPGVGLALLGLLAFVFGPKAASKERRLYLPRILVYFALFVALAGAFTQNWFQKNGAVEKGDWYLLTIGGLFLFSNAVGYAIWGRQNAQRKNC
jgi:drug/metabolite transporter (DMT)-like permease